MKFSKILLLIVVLAMAFAVAGCGADTTALESAVAAAEDKADAAAAKADDAVAAAADAAADAKEAMAAAAEAKADAAAAAGAAAEEVAAAKAAAEAAQAEAAAAKAEAAAAAEEAAAAKEAQAEAAAGAAMAKKTYAELTVCYPQLGAESDWRTANSASLKQTAEELGVNLIFSDAQQKQENQISAMRACIQQGVDVIALPPVVEDGWDAVLTEAQDAGIPVIIVDRSVSADPSLYAAHIGSDMVLEGQRAADEMNRLLPDGGKIVELSGTTGSGAAVGRAEGFRMNLNDNIEIIDSQTGNFTTAEGKPVMEAFLKKYEGEIDGAFIHNDNMAIGAVEAMKAAGLEPGEVAIVSVDGTRGGFQLMIDGWVQADVECNPLLGPQVMEMALALANGEPVERETLTNETVYYPEEAEELLPSRLY
jgi:simple sugar transport system substrate-binding protein